MKVKEFEKDALEAMKTKKKENAIDNLIVSIESIKEAEKTLKILKKRHKELLEKEVEDIDELEY